jgi:hypothetical protein
MQSRAAQEAAGLVTKRPQILRREISQEFSGEILRSLKRICREGVAVGERV